MPACWQQDTFAEWMSNLDRCNHVLCICICPQHAALLCTVLHDEQPHELCELPIARHMPMHACRRCIDASFCDIKQCPQHSSPLACTVVHHSLLQASQPESCQVRQTHSSLQSIVHLVVHCQCHRLWISAAAGSMHEPAILQMIGRASTYNLRSTTLGPVLGCSSHLQRGTSRCSVKDAHGQGHRILG